MRIVILIFCLLMAVGVTADTLGGLVVSARYRVGETDATASFAVDSVWYDWANQAQDKYIELNGYIAMRTDIAYSEDSLQYRLPANFKKSLGVLIKTGGEWRTALKNPYFVFDTSAYSTIWFVGWKGADTADLYIDKNLYEDDTIRVFYEGVAGAMTDTSSNCDIPDELEVFVIDEMILMYEQAKRAHGTQQALWQQIRTEQGIVEGKKE